MFESGNLKSDSLEAVIGLEVHLAVKTRSKMFCACRADGFGSEPNSNTCPVCLGLPGSLPVANHTAIDKALMFSLALHCRVPERTQFHRKNYFYPDAPKNYQISQFDRPLGEHGYLELADGRRIGVTRCHLEEDAGRSVHPPYADYSLVDLNRAGAPLVEMVTEPDLRTPEEAREFLGRVRAIAQALGASDASPEEGKMRADVNVSVRRPGEPLGTKVEVKNLNSFKSVQSALAFEIKRQTMLLEEGRAVTQQTRGWNEGGQKTYLMREKEGSSDYRYFADPDLPPITISSEWLERIRAATPELPDSKRERYLAAGVRTFDADLVAYDVDLSRFFDEALRGGGEPQAVANWLNGDVTGYLRSRGEALGDSPLTPQLLVHLVRLVEKGEISGKTAKDLLPEVMAGADPGRLVEERGLNLIADVGQIERLIDSVLDSHDSIVQSVGDNPKAINALLGLVMKESRGKAMPDLVRRLLNEKLGVPG
ncbi:MAG: Asp-tRNA(Asn)/Glu-tRNA(Gln) amidotransferase subunit GatB [Trueperaceae bacterium]